MKRTKIEWVLNPDNKTLGWIWNPLTGCLNHVNGMCQGGNFPCYAYKLANGRLKFRYQANHNIAGSNIDGKSAHTPDELIQRINTPFYPRFWPRRLKELWPFRTDLSDRTRTSKPKGIFICDMGELFGNWVPEIWQCEIFDAISSWPQHRFYLLTKQPQNLAKFSPFPDNCWVGVTATNREQFILAEGFLLDIKAPMKFISFEPLLERIIMTDEFHWFKHPFNWLIIGACTGSGVFGELAPIQRQYDLTLKQYGNKFTLQPKIEWVQEIVSAADRAGVPVFMKNNLMPLFNRDPHSYFFHEGLRQEMPVVK